MLPRPVTWLLPLVAAACLAMLRPAAAAELKLATLAPEGSSWLRELRAAGAEIGRQTHGRVVVKWYGSGVQGTDVRVLRKMRIGQLHGGTFTMSGLATVYPDAALYGLPLLFRSPAEVALVRRSLDPRLAAGFARAGLIVPAMAGTGFALLMGMEPIRSPADLAGKKVWLPEGDRASQLALDELGLAPVTLPVADVLTGLQTGLLDVVAAPPPAALIMQWHTRVRYVTDAPLAYNVTYLALDSSALGMLAERDREVVTGTLGAAFRRLEAAGETDQAAARRALKAAGVTMVAAEPGLRPGWERAVESSWLTMVQEGVVSASMLDEARRILTAARSAAAATTTSVVRPTPTGSAASPRPASQP
jgi:TRAP-type transport system periplasmic protein